MIKFFASCALLIFVCGCATGRGTSADTVDPQQERMDSIEPLDESKSVCGWSDTGRWECSNAGHGQLDKKQNKPKSKFSTEFKKGPPKEKASKLPRGDQPFDATPIDDGGGASAPPSDDDMN